jgi:2-polyprenyl-6-methoxyphenol hydroxylase-like FAD-dependent oxidoreductase
MTATDVVIVGGGIGGAALGGGLARAGLGVTILEATTEYVDRVRGESMQAWGVKEAQELGVEPVLLAAGAHVASSWKTFDDRGVEQQELPMGLLIPGVAGTLNLRHPEACQALVDDAARQGATVVRGVEGVEATPGPSPSVTYRLGDETSEVTADLVVGADGRASGVRRRAGITLEKQEATTYLAGLLLDGLDVPDEHDLMVSDPGRFSLLFHQGDGRARSYIGLGLSQKHRFAGPTAADEFRAACAPSAHPSIAALAEATAAGPCASYAGEDTWTATPYAEGVVLVGDAAGHNDPIIGQGLSITLRDARIVRDLVLDGARTPEAFAPYGAERVERMARLRLIADVVAVVQAEDADDQPARREAFATAMADADSGLLVLMLGAFAGPETVPAELVDETWPDRLRAAG